MHFLPYTLQLALFIVTFSFDHEQIIRNVFEGNIHLSQNILNEVSQDILHSDGLFNDDIPSPYLACGALSLMKSTKQTLQRAKGKDYAKTAFMKKSINTGCLLISSDTANQMSSIFDESTFLQIETFPFPYIMKVDNNTITYLNKKMTYQVTDSFSTSSSGNTTTDFEEINLVKSVFQEVSSEIKQIDLEFTPNALQKNPASYWSDQIFLSQPSTSEFLESNIWNELLFSKVGLTSTTLKRKLNSIDCDILPTSTSIEISSEGTHLVNLSEMNEICLGAFVHHSAKLPYVLRVSLGTKPKTYNHDAKGLTTVGEVTVKDTLLETFGLTGENQIIAVADTGINDLSCYFIDDSQAYDTITTDRTGKIELLRRKVIQYVGYADEVDDVGGHGTHVAGTVLGSNLYSDSTKLNGVAPNAKVAFYDIGATGDPYLYVPDLYNKLFPTAYAAGARVHTNSWGSSDLEYSYMSKDVDRFLYKNQDFLILFAAGNSGSAGLHTIGTPSNSKNCLTVGSTEVRDPEDDSLLTESTVAWFSSLGPTVDNRIKPEVVAPGSYVVSAFSGSGNILNTDTTSAESASGSCNCATTSKMGTSMATPVVAGLALLLRQYFMDPSFWASQCNSFYTTCQNGAFTPSGYLLKALLIHASQAIHRYSIPEFDFKTHIDSFQFKRIYKNLPDVMQGYGAVMLSNILPVVSPSKNNENAKNDNQEFDLIIFDQFEFEEYTTYAWDITFDLSGSYDNNTDNILPLKVTLCWFDPPSTVGFTSVLLIHDLDLMVVTPSGERLWGNNNKEGGDEHNPTEQLTIEELDMNCVLLSHCVYRVYIRSNTLPEAEVQKAAIVFTTTGIVTGPELTDNLIPFHHKNYTSGGDDDYVYYYDNYYYYYYGDYNNTNSTTNVNHSESANVNNISPTVSSVSKHSNSDHSKSYHLNSASASGFTITTTTSSSTTSLTTTSSNTIDGSNIITSQKLVSFPSTGLYVKMNEKGEYYRNIVTIGSFAYSGELSSIKVSLQYSKYSSMKTTSTMMCSGIYPFIMSLILIDPDDNRIQIGGNGWFAADDKLYTREWPRTWVRYYQASHIFEAIRGVTNAELEGSGKWKLEVALGYDWEISQTYYRGDVTLEYTTDTNSQTTQFCELPVTLYDTFGDGWNGAGVVVTGINNSYTGFYGPLDTIFYETKTDSIKVVLGLTVKLSIGYDNRNANDGSSSSSYLREAWEMFWEVKLADGSYTGDYQTTMTFTCNMTTSTTTATSNSNNEVQAVSKDIIMYMELVDTYAIYSNTSFANISSSANNCNSCKSEKKPKLKPKDSPAISISKETFPITTTLSLPLSRQLLQSTVILDKTDSVRGPPSNRGIKDVVPVLNNSPVLPITTTIVPPPPPPPLLLSVNYNYQFDDEFPSSINIKGPKGKVNTVPANIPIIYYAVSSSDRIQQLAADTLCTPLIPLPPLSPLKPSLAIPPLLSGTSSNSSNSYVVKTDCLQDLQDGSYVLRIAESITSSESRIGNDITWNFCDRSGIAFSELSFQVKGGECIPGDLLVFKDVTVATIQSMNTLLTYDSTILLIATEDISTLNMTTTDRQILQQALLMTLSKSLSTTLGITVILIHWDLLSSQNQYNYKSDEVLDEDEQQTNSNQILQLSYKIAINAEEYGIDGRNYESVQILSNQLENNVINNINYDNSDNSFLHSMTVANVELFDYTGVRFTYANKISSVVINEFVLSSVTLVSTFEETAFTSNNQNSHHSAATSFFINFSNYYNIIGVGVLVIVFSVLIIIFQREKSKKLPNSKEDSRVVTHPKINQYDLIECSSSHDFVVNMEEDRIKNRDDEYSGTGNSYDSKEPLVLRLGPL